MCRIVIRYGHTLVSHTALPDKVRLFHAAVDLPKRLHGIHRALRGDRSGLGDPLSTGGPQREDGAGFRVYDFLGFRV